METPLRPDPAPAYERDDRPYVPDLSVGYLFGRGWEAFKEHLGVLVGAFVVLVLLNSLLNDLGRDGISGLDGLLSLASLAVSGPLTAGMYWMGLKAVRREPVEFRDLFSGFEVFGRAAGVYILMMLAVIVGLIFLIVLGVVLSFITLAGLLALVIGVFFTGAFSVVVAAAAYEELALAEE